MPGVERKGAQMTRLLAAVLMAALLCLGCETMPWKKTSEPPLVEELEPLDPVDSSEPLVVPETGLKLSPEQRFKDIPLPQNVKEDLDKTFVFESSTLQIGRMVYTSRASMNELVQFYVRECPTADWKLENVLQAECTTLLFTKPGKRLDVTVQDLGLPRARSLVLILTPED